MPPLRASALALSCLFGASQALAQTEPAQTEPAQPSQPQGDQEQAPNVSCPGGAVFWAGAGPEVHVMRVGTMEQFNPTTGVSSGPSVVLQVRIRGKSAAAYGTSFEELRRAGPPEELEREYRMPIRWAPDLTTVPRLVTIVANDGNGVIAKLRLMKCLAQPKPRPARAQPTKRPANPGTAEPTPAAPKTN